MVKIYAAFHRANDRYYSGNDCYSGINSPDRFFHYSGRYLYFIGGWLIANSVEVNYLEKSTSA